jgi:DNA-binding GntR family transcriptional regulator
VTTKIRKALAELDLQPPERVTLNDQVYLDLRRLIMSGRLRPGQPISIRAVAGLVNVSPMPVRGALMRLVTESALDMRPNRTFAVPVLDAKDFREIADLRATLEGLATERAVKLLAAKDIAALKSINRKMFRGDLETEQYLDLNREFHFTIYEAAAMPRLLRIVEGLWLQIGPLLNLLTSEAEMRFGKETHDAIVNAIAAGDAAGARKAIVRDILDAAKVIVARLKASALRANRETVAAV